ncbi:single-stranded-DNA-specific exonuclease RecJ [Brunnivagina elsteri]|uniref:Single-stranded-DNA-specific exonuclease RecJ n=1 Tax=Brunnivagina elsteri CCALA 953 TaxID=987040 RepID=A0A2A2THZ6_9CYAN|nr:single-stranded-DNA-specific exonuclease RecJ [Calothrix elsteri]PAX53248.1 single-stranded-DNA-specific exonuclease RecJ [Calothrix elsteri CCALA 953]
MEQQWNLVAAEQPPEWFLEAVKRHTPNSRGYFAAQLLWQRGIRNPAQLEAFVNFKVYQPANALEFGEEMRLAVARLEVAREKNEKVAIWGDFDADGITSTSVLWDGLGQFFPQNTSLSYYIPNRMTESHGLNLPGIDNLAKLGCKLIVTCDTGSTNIDEIIYANKLGIDVIVTDHHTLPSVRPPVAAIINPRYLAKEHPLYHLSGVAVAYKLVEALYEALPNIPQEPLEDLLDLVAVGLIADLVQLSGDCRYLAQRGIQRLQSDFQQPPTLRRRPGLGRLLELCQKSGDRPTDISFGLGPRINAVSRIQGDARFCVELLTSRDLELVHKLAEEAELANSRRKSLQKDIAQQVNYKVSQLDLSTTSVIVLADLQWSAGVLGLVAGQVAQETGRPTILLSTEQSLEEREGQEMGISSLSSTTPLLARGSARSINSVDLYQLVKEQAHLLHRFGGHPFAAGLSIPVENIPIFTQAINQQLRRTSGGISLVPTVQADITVKVADLGKELFLEFKLLEPCGMGNPAPKLLIQNCWFENSWHRNQQDSKGKKIQYIKTEFNICDESTKNPFPGIWWGHYKEELPMGRCDCIAEIDFNSFKKRYEIRLIAVRSAQGLIDIDENNFDILNSLSINNQLNNKFALDWRNLSEFPSLPTSIPPLYLNQIPTSWDEIRIWIKRSHHQKKPLALAWKKPEHQPAQEIWRNLAGLGKYLARTEQAVTRVQLREKIGIGDLTLHLGLKVLPYLGIRATLRNDTVTTPEYCLLVFIEDSDCKPNFQQAEFSLQQFLIAVKEEQFQRDYFAKVPLSTILAMATR